MSFYINRHSYLNRLLAKRDDNNFLMFHEATMLVQESCFEKTDQWRSTAQRSNLATKEYQEETGLII
jgi:hypothetical protein